MRAAVLLLLLRAAGAIKLYLAPSCNRFPHPHPCGADSHAGLTPDAPLETVQRARDLLRASSDAEKRVELAGGVYELNATLELTAADSGTVWAAAAGGANVTLSGGEAMNPGWLKQVMNTDVLAQLPTDDARKHVRKVELFEHFLGERGVTMGNFSVRGSVNSNAALVLDMLKPSGIEFFAPDEDAAYMPARYPNRDEQGGFSKIEAVEEGSNNTFTPSADMKARASQWMPQLRYGGGGGDNSGDVWCHGYWSNRWADAHYSLASVAADGDFVLGGVPEALPDRTKEVCSGDCKPSKYEDGHKVKW